MTVVADIVTWACLTAGSVLALIGAIALDSDRLDEKTCNI